MKQALNISDNAPRSVQHVVTSSPERDDDHFHGWRLFAAWTACVLFSWGLLIGAVMALYEAIGFVRGLL